MRIHVIFMLSALVVMHPLGAQTLYKWTDAQGRVFYKDRPPNEKDRAVVTQQFSKKMLGVSAENEEAQKNLVLSEVNENKQKREQEERAKKLQEREQQEAEREKNCTLAQEATRQLNSGQRLAVVSASGERQVLTPEQIAKRLEEARKQEERACAPIEESKDVSVAKPSNEKPKESTGKK